MRPGHQLAWVVLGGFLAISVAAALDRGFAARIETQMKNALEGVSQSW